MSQSSYAVVLTSRGPSSLAVRAVLLEAGIPLAAASRLVEAIPATVASFKEATLATKLEKALTDVGAGARVHPEVGQRGEPDGEERVRAAFAEVWPIELFETWFHRADNALGGVSPRDAVAAGRATEAISALESAAYGEYS